LSTTRTTNVIFDPHPRESELIFSESDWQLLNSHYQLLEPPLVNEMAFYDAHIATARYIIGQPPLDRALLEKADNLRAIFNVESNFLDNMDYQTCFNRGIHVLSTSPVFAMPVAELGLGLALSLLRDIPAADQAFQQGSEVYGLEGNRDARMLTGAKVGFIGFGDLGVALHSVLRGFDCQVNVYDPWLPASILQRSSVNVASLHTVLTTSDIIFVVAATTNTNAGSLGEDEFALMQKGASLVLLSRAGVVDFAALIAAVNAGHIKAATDVFPTEPVPQDDVIRRTPNMIFSPHRAGALDQAFKQMGRFVIEDMQLMDAALAPRCCKRAERETVGRWRSS